MIKRRSSHQSASFNINFFSVGGDHNVTCEVYDSICKKFVLLKSPDNRSHYYKVTCPDAVISIGSKFYVFHTRKKTYFIYDIENEIWSEEPFNLSINISNFSCAKLPQF